MAKPKKIKNSTIINITSKTKDRTYIIDSNAVSTATVNFYSPYANMGTAMHVENSDDLCLFIPTYINELSAKIKYAILIIKDYFKYCETNENLVQVNGESILNKVNTSPFSFNNSKKIETVLDKLGIAGGKKNTTYTITGIENNDHSIIDIKGNDKYIIKAPYDSNIDNSLLINEQDGNDKYILTNNSHVAVAEYTGKDKYTINNSTIQIEDFFGKDKYTAENVTGGIVDQRGKDKYTISNAGQFFIYDMYGNDTYKLTNVRTTDKEGKIDETKTLIADRFGNDKYTISGSDTYLFVNDFTGKDTYNIKGKYDKKTKTATYVGFTKITDNGYGKNTFNLNYADGTTITAENNKNVFNVKNCIGEVTIKAGVTTNNAGTNKYTLTSNEYYDIYNYGTTNDSYNIINSATGEIADENGNDTYKINALNFRTYTPDETLAGISIKDMGGTKDTLTLKTTKTNNIVYMSDFYMADETTSKSWSNSLIIYDKSTQGYAYIKDFYSTDENNDFNGFGTGLIETVKAKKGKKLKTLDVSKNSDYYEHLNSVKENVVSWINDNSVQFSCVEDVLLYGTQDQKNELVNIFTNQS